MSRSLSPAVALKIRSSNLISSSSCPNGISMHIWLKSVNWFMRYCAQKKLPHRPNTDVNGIHTKHNMSASGRNFNCLPSTSWSETYKSKSQPQMSCLTTKPTKRLRSARASAQSYQSLRCALTHSSGPKLSSCRQRRLWSDWADAQVDLNKLGTYAILMVCHEAAQICLLNFQDGWVFLE